MDKYVIFDLWNLWIFLTKPPTRPMVGQWLVTNLVTLVTLEQGNKLEIGMKNFLDSKKPLWPAT